MSYPGYPGYPPTSGQPAYPSGQPPYPGQPGYPPQPGYPQAGYPAAPQPGFPQPSYPPQHGYPSSSPYPPQPSYPSQPGYPQATSYPPQPGYPTTPAQPAYPSGPNQGYPQAGYPSGPAQPAYPPSSGAPGYPSVPSATYPGQAPAFPSQAYPTSTMPSTMAHSAPTGQPTLRPFQPFNPRSDAEALKIAMKGFGTDEKAIINILTKRTDSQRQEIVIQFKSLYGKDLVDKLKGECTGKFEDLVVALATPRYQYYAKEIHHALSLGGYRPESVTEIICSSSNEDIRQIRAAYDRVYSKSLENKIKDDTSGDYKRVLISLCQARRDENTHIDVQSAQNDAQALYSAGELKWGTDESVFNAILTNRSYVHLAQVFTEYQRITGRDFESAVSNEFSGDIKTALLAIVKCVRNKQEFYAEQLWASMKGAGTNDRTLIRILVTRSEVDLADIKRVFQSKYGQTLEAVIEGDTSGDYRRGLLSLAT